MKAILTLLPAFLLPILNRAQPAPAPAQSEPVAIVGATIHTATGRVIDHGVLIFENGRITAVDDLSRNTEWTKDRYRQIRADGKHLWPGLVALNTTLGLNEIDAVRATRDDSEIGENNINARTIIAYDADSRVIPTVRTNGILTAQIIPEGGRWSGLSSVVQLDAWNWEDAAVKPDEGIHLNWPDPYGRHGRGPDRRPGIQNTDYDTRIDELTRWMTQAQAYARAESVTEQNRRFEAAALLFSGQRKLYIHVQDAPAILDALRWADQFGITPVLVGARDAWMIKDELKRAGASVVVVQTHRLPSRSDEEIDLPYRLPSILIKAGIPCAIAVNGFWQQRNLAYQAGEAAAWMTPELALQAITIVPARILGLDKRLGSLEVGKDATLVLTPGDLLDMRSSEVEAAFIQGRELDLDNKQKQLYRMYKEKYSRKK